MSDMLNYDTIVLEEHLEKIGCKAPYQKTISGVKTCQSREKMKGVNLDAMGRRHSRTACTSAATITFTYEEIDRDMDALDSFWVCIIFPDTFKEIVMVKAVDIQTAIGNAGGYIGILLGNVNFELYDFYGRYLKH